ncbi:4-hydroxybenzoate polyprenyltransferase-like prenyltransferase [Halovivax ruber XH-70]|uniref:4-hydroxybenzoate polyprenyltransferase-like prenyltransferase n=1 Tax=Halovivax ruber (strain DSM 18193 / JCM 13892 / XH-70) TaxID=797302 RepID=L0IB48_HALRX|nr:UbiA family prenyltransferase [Halovivax ruber]AGB16048.1 4-hydroxybenzoate polyprenyltransferase-like prenyltransferase [Halovivax ruber XH-70]
MSDSVMDASHGRSDVVDGMLTLVHSNVFIALAATSWVVTTAVLAGLPLDPLPPFIVFAVTLFVYSLNRFTDIDEDEYNVPGRAAFTKRYGRFLLIIGTLAYLGAVGFALAFDLPRAELLLAPIAVITLYSVLGLKRIFLVKNLLVGIAWGGIPLGVGVYYGVPMDTEILLLTAYVVAMLTIAAVIFDLKDIVGDRHEGIVTVPRVIGTRRTRLYSAGATVVVTFGVVAAIWASLVPPRYLVLLAFSAYVFSYCLSADPDASPLFYGLVVDGEHLFFALLVAILAAIGVL